MNGRAGPAGYLPRAAPLVSYMAIRLSYCRYRLLFRHPFGTAHGLRDGTDSVFIRAEEAGRIGYGEATLPPYLAETQDSVIQRIAAFVDPGTRNASDLGELLAGEQVHFRMAPAARAALQMALFDLDQQRLQITDIQYINNQLLKSAITLKTVGSGALEDLPAKLEDTRGSKAIKVKLGSKNDRRVLELITQHDDRPLFLDANQGLGSVQEALDRIAWAGADRVIGMEQPFPKNRPDMHAELKRRTEVPVYGDESIQGHEDLAAAAGTFGGVNVKLMKCGGLDLAEVMIDQAERLGLKVMLGSMSESSLGCTAMGRLAGRADVVDLDGPWLITNDPFRGMDMVNGNLVIPVRTGIGAVLVADLPWTPFGA